MMDASWKLALQSIADRAWLVPPESDEQEAMRLEHIRQEVEWARETLGRGMSDAELSLRHEYRIRFRLINESIDPDSLTAETAFSVGARLLPLVLAVVRPTAG